MAISVAMEAKPFTLLSCMFSFILPLVYVFRFQTQERGAVQQSRESVNCEKTNGPELAAREDEDAINIDIKQ